MSAHDPLPDELTGAFLEIAKVTDLGAVGETEEIAGSTTADVTFEVDQTRAEGNKHSQRRSLSKPTYNTVTIEVPHMLTPGADELETFGFVDSEGEEVYNNGWEAARIHVYDEEPGDSVDPSQSFEFEDVEWNMDSVELGEDFGTVTGTGYVHGPYRRGTTDSS